MIVGRPRSQGCFLCRKRKVKVNTLPCYHQSTFADCYSATKLNRLAEIARRMGKSVPDTGPMCLSSFAMKLKE